jgi:hypothetical protein
VVPLRTLLVDCDLRSRSRSGRSIGYGKSKKSRQSAKADRPRRGFGTLSCSCRLTPIALRAAPAAQLCSGSEDHNPPAEGKTMRNTDTTKAECEGSTLTLPAAHQRSGRAFEISDAELDVIRSALGLLKTQDEKNADLMMKSKNKNNDQIVAYLIAEQYFIEQLKHIEELLKRLN